MIQRTYEAKITPAHREDPVVVSLRAFDRLHAKELIEEKFGPVKKWWSEPNPNLLS
jgi:hypothetical protein